ncbi:hypothetical protein OG439_22745 [Amycolatopsis sp. NBC_01307]|uniref:hypothetical protein n=1 Tax=Amycolatopsis sp. NBC_01307 TaxID=2903561 RepID=UPI002E0F30C7|nr:hypothetical protein OG439_22745 [Amycolatopsis sp. NBC_01307]
MDHRKHFADIHRRPQLYGLDGSYHDYCTYLLGVDAGHDGGLLTGFKESLVPRVGTGDNLTWTSLVLYLAFPGRTSGWHDEAAGDGRQVAVDLLFTLLDEFLETRSRARGTAAIFAGYLAWREAQPWARPASLGQVVPADQDRGGEQAGHDDLPDDQQRARAGHLPEVQ